MSGIIEKSLTGVRELLKSRSVSSVEVTKEILKQIRAKEGLNSFVTVCESQALAAAEDADKRLAAGEEGALLGVPVAVKDNICTAGIRTTCSSKFLENYIPPYDAFVVEKIKAAGGVIVGKTNMDEFAMGSTCEYSAFFPGRNAVNPDYVAGGSSGGSAAAVGSYQCYASLGSDTGGSIRQPAAFNGVVGLKPTYSAVSRYGAVAFASSLDQIGTITRTVADNKVMFDVIKGHDKRDTTSFAGDYEADKPFNSLKGKRIGIAKEFFPASLNKEVKKSVEDAVKVYAALGAEIVDVSISSFGLALSCYYILSCAEAASNLARFDGIKYGRRAKGDNLSDIYYNSRTEGVGDEVKRRLMLGNFVLSSGYYDAYYLRAQKARTLIKQDFDNALAKCDVMLSPTSPTTAFKLGQKLGDTVDLYLADMLTVPVNIAGIPAISIKCGFDSANMPIGLQLIAGNNKENTLFSFAGAYEEAVK